MLKVRNRNDQQETMFGCEINKMARGGKVRVLELIPSLITGARVLRADFVSLDPPRVFGAAAVLIEEDATPFQFTDKLRELADNLDEFLHRGQDD
jgi:hypothetical protein